MKIAVPKESQKGESRVSVVPSMISALIKGQHEVMVEEGAGHSAFFHDEQYREAGAKIVAHHSELFNMAHVILKVQPPGINPEDGFDEVGALREGSVLLGFLAPTTNPDMVTKLAARGVTSFAMEFIPRITRAQGMDALSSMATVAGYKAALMAANHVGKFFPLLMTAAGTVPPATVLVLGAGVAGLQAIATAKRLGAKVEAFDPRPAVEEQVNSLGAQFVHMEMPEDVETEDGYAKEQSSEFLHKEQEAIRARLGKVDAVITTAQIFGKEAPILITEEMVHSMRPGSVIVDLAAEHGGNCAYTQAGKTLVENDVTIMGVVNLPSTLPTHASQMYSKNITNLFKHLFQGPGGKLDFDDEITKGACITLGGQIVKE